ncbi:MAG: hypothetical protein B7X11_00455, partial [Acidobacteria bacterium 37-65-4]
MARATPGSASYDPAKALDAFGRLRREYPKSAYAAQAALTMALLAQVREELRRIHRSLVDQHQANENTFPKVTPLSERYFGPGRLVINVL